jgi:hypothetical protein
MTERSFGGAGDRGLYCPRSPSGYGRISAAPMSSKPAGPSFGERSIGE